MRADGAMDLYHGGLRARDADGGDDLRPRATTATTGSSIFEEVKAWSYMKFPYFTALGHEEGWYRVGPLTRVTRATSFPRRSPTANGASSWRSTTGAPAQSTLGFHWARMIEMLHAAEAIKDLLHDGDLQGTD